MKYTIPGLLCAAALTACQTVTSNQTLPDGTKVQTVARSTDPVAIANAVAAAKALAPVIKELMDKEQPAMPVTPNK